MLSEVPQGWDELLFGELTSIVGGTTPKKNIEEYWDSEDVLWATPTDITSLPEASHFLSDTATKASIRAVERGGLKLLPANTVLMTSRATIGYVAIAKSEISTNQGFANFLPSEKYVPLFLLYLLQSKKEQLISSAGGSTFKEISKGILKSLSTLLPPLNEQHRIAEILSSVDESIQATQAVIKQAERVKRGLMEELLTGGLGSEAIERGEVPQGWEGTTFGRQIDFKGGNQPPKSTFVYEPTDGYVRLLQIRDFENDDKPAYIPAGATKVRCTKKDILIARYGASLGRICRGKEGAYNVALVKLMLSDKLYSDFTYYWLNGEHFQNFLARVGSRSAQAGFNKDDLAPLSLAIPPLTEQKRIAEILSSVDETIASHKANIEQQSLVKKGLMDDLLTGKVRTV
jgi:type I restriction enzyme, S subunit